MKTLAKSKWTWIGLASFAGLAVSVFAALQACAPPADEPRFGQRPIMPRPPRHGTGSSDRTRPGREKEEEFLEHVDWFFTLPPDKQLAQLDAQIESQAKKAEAKASRRKGEKITIRMDELSRADDPFAAMIRERLAKPGSEGAKAPNAVADPGTAAFKLGSQEAAFRPAPGSDEWKQLLEATTPRERAKRDEYFKMLDDRRSQAAKRS